MIRSTDVHTANICTLIYINGQLSTVVPIFGMSITLYRFSNSDANAKLIHVFSKLSKSFYETKNDVCFFKQSALKAKIMVMLKSNCCHSNKHDIIF